jgi:hypothetical protein
MHIVGKILIGFILLAALGLFVLAAAVANARHAWMRRAHVEYELPLAQVRQQVDEMRDGDPLETLQSAKTAPRLSLSLLRVGLHDVLVDRGRVWRGCVPQGWDQQVVTVAVPQLLDAQGQPVGSGLKPQYRVFVFEEKAAEQGGAYLGEYLVTNVDAAQNTVLLNPVLALSARQQQRLAASVAAREPWMLFEIMPRDTHEHFSSADQPFLPGINEAGLRAMMPNVPDEVISQYLRHGAPAEDDDPPNRVLVEVRFLRETAMALDDQGRESVRFAPGQTLLLDLNAATEQIRLGNAEEVGRRYNRELRDYNLYFHDLHRQSVWLYDRIVKLQQDIGYLTEAAGKLQTQIDARTAEIENELKPEKTRMEGERDLMESHRLALEQKLAETQAAVEALLAENRRLAREWAAVQTRVAEEIERAAQAAVQP